MQVQAEDRHHNLQEYVTFSVAEQVFCLRITQIREIRRWSPVTILPHAPAYVLGVMNLRGAVIPICDLAVRLGLQRTDDSERNVVVVVNINGNLLGLLVESVSEIISIDPEEVQDTPSVDSRDTKEFVQGIISKDGQMVRIVDLNSVGLSDQDTL